MSHYRRHSPAVDNVIKAGQGNRYTTATVAAETFEAPSPTCKSDTPPWAATLLLAIMSRIPAGSLPFVQFVTCCHKAPATSVALAVSAAASALVGKSLLLDATTHNCGKGSFQGDTLEPLPDVFVPKLYHCRLYQDISPLSNNFRALVTKVIAPFQFAAVDSGFACDSPTSRTLASRCMGTILVIHAGASSQGTIKQSILTITKSGGSIIGSVLVNVPFTMPC